MERVWSCSFGDLLNWSTKPLTGKLEPTWCCHGEFLGTRYRQRARWTGTYTQLPLHLSLYRRIVSLIAEKQQSYYRQILYWLRCKLSFSFLRDILRRSGLSETCVLIKFLLPVVVHVLCTHGFFVIINANSHIYTKYTHGMQFFFFDMLHAWQRSTRQAQVRCRAISETSQTRKT